MNRGWEYPGWGLGSGVEIGDWEWDIVSQAGYGVGGRDLFDCFSVADDCYGGVDGKSSCVANHAGAESGFGGMGKGIRGLEMYCVN